MKFKSDIEVQAGLKDSSGSAGTSGKILSSTGTGVAWVDDNPGITGSGTTNYVPKWTSGSAIGNSLIYDNGTNVGIGSATPGNKLSIFNTLGLPSSSALSEAIVLVQDSGSNRRLGIGSSTSGQWIQSAYPGVEGITSNLLLNPSGGNIGIGTTTPDSKLDVTGGDITVNTSGTGFMNFKYGSVGAESAIGTVTTDGINLKVNATANLHLLPTGNVLIGTTTDAGYKLDVNGTGRFLDNLTVNKEGGIIGIDASNNPRIGFVKKSGEQPFLAFASAPFLLKVSSGSEIFASNTFTTVLSIATSGAATFSSTVTASGNISTTSVLNARTNPVSYGTNENPYYSNAISFLNATNVPAYIQIGNSGLSDYGSWLKFQVNSVNTANTLLDVMTLTPQGGGRVGIGTNFPSALLDIVGASATEQFRIGNTTGGTDFGITVTENASTIINSAEGATGRGIQFQSGGTNTVLINSSGSVGIGTTAPSQKLEVNDGATNEIASFRGVSNSVPFQILGNVNVGDYWRGVFTGQNIITNATTGKPSIRTAGFRASAIGYSADSAQGYIGFFTTNSTTANTDLSERMRITEGGNVGIGTSSPIDYTVYGYGANVENRGGRGGGFVSTDSGATNRMVFSVDGNASVGQIKTVTNTPLTFGVNDSERMRITSGGNVLIGTTTDAGFRLDVNGTGRFSGTLRISNTTPTQEFYSTGNGDVWGSIKAEASVGTGGQLAFSTKRNGNTETVKIRVTESGNTVFYPNLPVVISGIGNPYYGSNITLASDTGSTQGANRIWSRYDATGRAALTFETATNVQSYNSDPTSLTYTEYMRITGLGNVGIGTNNPAFKLTVQDTGSTYMSIDSTGNDYRGIIGATGSGLKIYSRILSTSASAPIAFVQGGDETFTMFPNGNTFIGTSATDAGYKLNVKGDGNYSGRLDVGMSPAPFWNARFRDYNDGSGVHIGSVASGGYKFIAGDSYYNNSGYWQSVNTTSSVVNLQGGNFVVYTNNGLTANTNFVPTERLRINTSGAVTVSNLGGTGTRIVTADANGTLSTTTDGAITTYNSTLTLDTTWKNTGITSANIGAQGVYLVTCFVNDYPVGGGQYSCTYVGTMFFYTGGTNGVNANEIALHHSGHADNNRYIYLRTLSSVSAGDGKLYLQIKGNGSNSGNSTYAFTFKKLL